ncbi:MAG: cadherin repeat domain-containing protein, partial [Planctomycetaceae bacterium]|nr:cadherin repeat domain-containing protein [Planctomycetaceae bacterium]
MPRNWLQKVCDQLSPASLSKVERRPRGRIPARVEPLEVRTLLANPTVNNPPGAPFTIGENIGTNLAGYTDPVTGTTQTNTTNGFLVANLTATDTDAGDSISSWRIVSGNGPNNDAFRIDNNGPFGGRLVVNNFAAINFENTPTFTLGVQALDTLTPNGASATLNITVNVTNRNDVPFIVQNQFFTVAENAVAGTVLNNSPVQAFTAINQNPATPGTSLNPNDPNFAGGRGTNNVSGQTDSNNSSAGDGVQNGTLRYEILRASSSTVTQGGVGNEVQNISKDGALFAGQFILSHTSQLPITSSTNGANNEVQSLDMGAVPNSTRFFTLTFTTVNPDLTLNRQTTRHLHYNSTPAEVQAELELLSNIGAGNVGVTGGGGSPWNIEFIGTLQQTDVQTLDVTAYTDSLNYGDLFSDNAANIQAALAGLPTIGAGNVAVSALAGGTGWQVTFQGALANTNVNQIGVLNRNDILNISSDTPTLGRLTITQAPDPYLIGSRAFDGQAGLVSGIEFQNAFFGGNQFAVLVRVADRSVVNSQGTNVANGLQTLSYTEYIAVAITDQSEAAPQVQDKTFNISESSPNGAVVGKVDEPGNPNDVVDPEGTQSFSYQIIGGNTNGAFAINSLTSEITVANSAALDFETGPAYRLLVRVTDSASPNLSTVAAMDINLLDFNEPTTIPDGQSFDV